MGCDGRTPNVICPSRINPIVRAWLDALPNPTSDGPLNNYLGPADPRHDPRQLRLLPGPLRPAVRRSDHMFASFWHQRAPAKFESVLPQSIAYESYSDPQNSWVNRFNWDRTFSPTLLNHMSMGYLNRNEGYGSVNQDFVDDFPQIPGVAGYQRAAADHVRRRLRPARQQRRHQRRQRHDAADLHHQRHGDLDARRPHVQGRHGVPQDHGEHPPTATRPAPSTSSAARPASSASTAAARLRRFLLGAVDNGNADLPRRRLHAIRDRTRGSCTPATPGGSTTASPSTTACAGTTTRRRPRSTTASRSSTRSAPTPARVDGPAAWPSPATATARRATARAIRRRTGTAASRRVSAPSTRSTTRRSSAAAGASSTRRRIYPGWGGGISQDGFSNNPGFSSTLGGIQPAFYLDQGLPQNFQQPPDIRSDYRNGQGILYRPLDANERPYAHQWNVSVDRELGANLSLSVAYVGSAGRRLPSSIEPLNAIDPAYLSLGDRLNDEFQPGMTSLNGVPLPYPGWVEQMTGCAPSVAQALRPYPQYCDNLQGLNENKGTSHYNSLQVKLEKRFSGSTYALVSYTLSKTISSGSDNTQRDAGTWSGLQGVISPFERDRNEAIAATDTPHVLSAAFVYQLPFGEGKKWANTGGVVNALVGGWQMSTIFRYSSGLPLYFRSSFCNVPGQFRAGCIPAIINPVGGVRPGQGRLRSRRRGRCSTPRPSSRSMRSTTTTGRATASRKRCAASAITTRISRSSRTPSCPATPTSSSGSRPSTSGTGTSSRTAGEFGGARLHQRPRQPGLRQMEWHRDRPAIDPARVPVRVLTMPVPGGAGRAGAIVLPGLVLGCLLRRAPAARTPKVRTCRRRSPAASPTASPRCRAVRSMPPKPRSAPCCAPAATAPSSITTSASSCSGAAGTPPRSPSSIAPARSIRASGRRGCSPAPA